MKEARQRIAIYILTAAVSISALLLPAMAQAQGNKSIIDLPWDNPVKKPVPPALILPQQNRWGCLSCHSNRSLSKFLGGREVSLFIDSNIIGKSMHKQIACIDCHTNFSYDEHPAKSPTDFAKVAGLACMKCHPYQAYLYKNSVHGRLALQNKLGKIAGKPAEPALCSSCHGSHDIQSPRFEPYKSKFRAAGKEVCGKCHTDRYATYSDYYHGEAYKNKAKDAPACWDCHSNHRVIKKTAGVLTPVSESRLSRTCGKCHDNPTRNLTSYAPLIHNRAAEMAKNPIYSLLSIFIKREEIAAEPQGQKPVARTEIVAEPRGESFISRMVGFFFPKSLRPQRDN
ncbi:MAG: hypothetical protein Q8L35_04950 [Actinomycetota bacterium]|nr:hypothetical protein [Actinomycetota bacterium]